MNNSMNISYISKFTVAIGCFERGCTYIFLNSVKKGLQWTCLTDGKMSPFYNSYAFQ